MTPFPSTLHHDHKLRVFGMLFQWYYRYQLYYIIKVNYFCSVKDLCLTFRLLCLDFILFSPLFCCRFQVDIDIHTKRSHQTRSHVCSIKWFLKKWEENLRQYTNCLECSECRVKSSIRVSKSNRYQKSGVRHTHQKEMSWPLEWGGRRKTGDECE